MIGELNLLKNIKVNKKWSFYNIVYIVLIVKVFVGLILPYFILARLRYSKEVGSAVSLSSIAGYLRFLSEDKSQMIVRIAVHNIAIAIFGFIASFLSAGIIGGFFLLINCFVLSTTLFGIHTLPAIIFVSLEFLGICIAIFGGTKLSQKRKNGLSFNGIFKNSSILILIIIVIYFIAAIIESKIILNQWG